MTTTMREVFCGVISQGVAPYFFMKICSFFGHRSIEASSELCSALENEIRRAINLGCLTFYFGGFGEFDELCHKTVSKIKSENNSLEIKRIYCVPQERYLRKGSRYYNRDDYEEIIYLEPAFEGWYKSIYFRNCAMIDKSEVVIFYAEERIDSGAYKAYKYAKQKKEKLIINLWN